MPSCRSVARLLSRKPSDRRATDQAATSQAVDSAGSTTVSARQPEHTRKLCSGGCYISIPVCRRMRRSVATPAILRIRAIPLARRSQSAGPAPVTGGTRMGFTTSRSLTSSTGTVCSSIEEQNDGVERSRRREPGRGFGGRTAGSDLRGYVTRFRREFGTPQPTWNDAMRRRSGLTRERLSVVTSTSIGSCVAMRQRFPRLLAEAIRCTRARPAAFAAMTRGVTE